MIRELLTKLSSISKPINDKIEELGFIGKVIAFFGGLFLLFGPFLIAMWIIEALFPNFWNFGERGNLDFVITLLAIVIWGILMWLFAWKPKDYVASKAKSDIYKILTELAGKLDQAAKVGVIVDLKEDEKDGYQYFITNIKTGKVSDPEKVSRLKIRIEELVKSLNSNLKKIVERGSNITVDYDY